MQVGSPGRREPAHMMMFGIFIQDSSATLIALLKKTQSFHCLVHTRSHSLPVKVVFFSGKQSP